MNSSGKHPEDFSPYLDRDLEDSRYDEIRRHIESCPKCREEIRIWRSLDDLFRTPGIEVEVPPFQWARIEAKLKAARPGILERLTRLLDSRRLARRLAQRLPLTAGIAFVLIAAFTFSGVQYRRYIEKRDFADLLVFSESETRRISETENPFRALLGGDADENPFSRFRTNQDDGTFSIRP